MVVTRGWGKREWANECKVLVLQDEESSGDLLHDSVNTLNITELYTEEWLGW
jgi:hypothetical protein